MEFRLRRENSLQNAGLQGIPYWRLGSLMTACTTTHSAERGDCNRLAAAVTRQDVRETLTLTGCKRTAWMSLTKS